MVLLELFSGIGGFSKGLEAAGYAFDTVYYSEIDKSRKTKRTFSEKRNVIF